jgi:transglutaminase-like putative cysteine protease
MRPQLSGGAREQRDQAVLLVAVAVAVLPHLGRMPPWELLAIAAAWLWRAWLLQGLRPAPGRLTMALLLLTGITAVWVSHGGLAGREASVNLLLLLVGLKVLEMRARRDVLVIVCLTLFVLFTDYLFDQGALALLVQFGTLFLLFLVLLGTHLPEADMALGRKLRVLGSSFALGLPLALALFFLFPRLASPLWHWSMQDPSAATGLSDAMSPGSIGHLLRSDAVVLRAQFTGPVPASERLFWRGPVLGRFDGRTWTTLPLAADDPLPRAQVPAGGLTDYTVTLEPTGRPELPVLELTVAVDGVRTQRKAPASTLGWLAAEAVNERLRFHARAALDYQVAGTEPPMPQQPWLQLPETGNPRSLALARTLRERLAPGTGAPGEEQTQALAATLLQRFHTQDYHYNIDAPVLRRDPVDAFLFETRTGFCEHYASAFVVLLRAMGVPARVVTGYQGGELNTVDGFLTVRQSDAHAWAEYWSPSRGWQRADPTAAVARSRIDRTLRDAALAGGGGGTELPSLWRRLRMDREALENAWNQWFLSYSAARQRELLGHLGLEPSLQNVTLVACLAIACMLLVLIALGLRRERPRDPHALLALVLRTRLRRAGLAAPAHMGLAQICTDLRPLLTPACHAELAGIVQALQRARYAPAPPGRSEARQLRQRLRRWRIRATRTA